MPKKKIKPFAEHDLRVTLEWAGKNNNNIQETQKGTLPTETLHLQGIKKT